MDEKNITNWLSWSDKEDLKQVALAGIYIIAKSDQSLAGRQFKWQKEIIYIGMTNSKGGLRKRLKQFEDTFYREKPSHGGADRVRYKYPVFDQLKPQLYIAIYPVTYNLNEISAGSLRQMGEVLRMEFYAFAKYFENFGRLPEFNDEKISPKFSKRI